jgi:hypothetical protein
MSQRSLLKIVCLMILVTSAVAVSLKGWTRETHRELLLLKIKRAATQTTVVSLCRRGFVHQCLSTTSSVHDISPSLQTEMST